MRLVKKSEKSGFRVYLEAFQEVQDDPRVEICNLTQNHRGWISTFCDNVKLF